MHTHAYKYTDDVVAYVKENAGKIAAKDIASHIGVTVVALRRQCVVWREKGEIITSLRKTDPIGTIKTYSYKDGHQEKHIKSESGKWVNLCAYNYKKYHGEIPDGFRIKFNDGSSLNCEPENLSIVTIGEYFSGMASKKHANSRNVATKNKPKKIRMPRVVKPSTRGTTSQKKKPGTDANWTQRHLLESKEMKIPEAPKGFGIRIDSRTIVFPKNADTNVEALRTKYIKNYDSIKEEIKSYASNDF
jgi:hypothetical protein